MRKFLIITYYWPPSGGSGVQRWVKFCKYLPSEGWEPVVYTPENPEAPSIDRSLEGDIPDCAKVLKRPIHEVYSLWRRLSGKKESSQVNPINHQKKSAAQKFAMWVRGNFFVPDPKAGWVRSSVRFLRRYLRDNPVDIIVTTGPPHSMHLIGERLSGKTGLPWVADFRDPWTKIFYFKHLPLAPSVRRKHEKLEKQVLDSASAVVAVSPLVEEEFRAMTATRICLVTNGYDEEDFGQVVEPDGFYNIVHTGLFAADGNPSVLWRVLADMCAEDPEFSRMLRIRLAGKTDVQILESIRDAGLDPNLVDLGYRDHTSAVREQLAASLLLLPLRKEPEYRATLPGKLFEYLGARRPVLGIGQTDGAMARILEQTGAGTTSDWDDARSIRKCIETSWQSFASGLDPSVDGDIRQYSRKATAAKMAALFNSLAT